MWSTCAAADAGPAHLQLGLGPGASIRSRGLVLGALWVVLVLLWFLYGAVRCRTVSYGVAQCCTVLYGVVRCLARVSYGVRTESTPYATYGAPLSGFLGAAYDACTRNLDSPHLCRHQYNLSIPE